MIVRHSTVVAQPAFLLSKPAVSLHVGIWFAKKDHALMTFRPQEEFTRLTQGFCSTPPLFTICCKQRQLTCRRGIVPPRRCIRCSACVPGYAHVDYSGKYITRPCAIGLFGDGLGGLLRSRIDLLY